MTSAWTRSCKTLMMAGLAANLQASEEAKPLATLLMEPPAPPAAKAAPLASAEAPLNAYGRLCADLSHFFEGNLPRGTIRELALDPEHGHPKRLVVMNDALGWTSTGSNVLFLIFPDGLGAIWQPSETVDFGWCPDKETAWLASHGGQKVSMLPAQAFARSKPSVSGRAFGPLTMPPSESASRPGGLVRSPNGWFYRLNDRGGVYRFPSSWVYKRPGRDEDCLHFSCRAHGIADLPLTSLVAGTHGKVLGLAKEGIAIFDADQPLDGAQIHILGVKGAGRAIAADQGIWFTLPASNQIGFHAYPSSSGAMEACRLWSLGSTKGQVFDLVLGPDGHLWFTELLAGNIGRLDPGTGTIKRYPLPIPGSKPAFIVNGGDGKLYFTELGAHRLGSIAARVVARAQAAQAPQEGPAPLQAKEPEAATDPQALGTPPPPVRAAAVLEPLAALDRRCPGGVNWAHIRSDHYYGVPTDKGQFHRAWSEDARAAELIHQCLIDPLCPPFLTYEGKWMVLHTFKEEIGFYLKPDRHWAGTRNLVVVLSQDRTFVVTAYPVGPNF